MYFRRDATNIKTDFPLGEAPATRVFLLISLLRRTMALLVRIRLQCSRGSWIGYTFLDDFEKVNPAFLNSTGVMYRTVECSLRLLCQCM